MAAEISTKLVNEIGADFLTCTICFNQYREPKTLPCLHTFCEICLLPLVVKKALRCPACRKPASVPKGGVSQLKTNFFITNLMELLNKRGEELIKSASQSEGFEPSIRASRLSLIEDLQRSGPETIAAILKEKIKELQRKEHEVADTITTITLILSELMDKQKIEESKVTLKSDDVVRKVRTEEQKLVEQIHTNYSQKDKILQDHIQKLEKLRTNIASTYSYLETLVSHGDTGKLLSTQQATIKCIEELISMDVAPQSNDDLLTFHPKDAFSEHGILGKLESGVSISDFTVTVENVPTQLLKGGSATVLISTKDGNDRLAMTHKEMTAKLQTPDKPWEAIPITDNRDGTYRLTVYGETEGKCKLAVRLGGKSIQGSPFTFPVVKGLVKRFGKYGSSQGDFNDPWGLALNKDGDIVTADRGNKRVQVTDWDGKCKKNFHFTHFHKPYIPCDVAVSNDNTYFSLDISNKQIVVSDEDGNLIRCFGQHELKKPKGIAISPLDGAVYVTDRAYNNSYIRIYRQSGSYITSISCRGKPTTCCFNTEGTLYVTDKTVLDYQGIKIFDSNFRYQRKIRDIGKDHLFHNPRGVAVDEDGYVYVCDEHRILKISGTGEFICRVDSQADRLSYPSGIVVTDDVPRKLIVADKGNHCIKVFVL